MLVRSNFAAFRPHLIKLFVVRTQKRRYELYHENGIQVRAEGQLQNVVKNNTQNYFVEIPMLNIFG